MTQSSKQVRQSFLDFFQAKQHKVQASGSLIPANDPTLMFVNAGMVPFKNVFTGEEKKDFVRATSSQKCIRISGKHNDLENVGVTARHHTFFEMLGNFSFGDYFKKEAIEFAWEYLTKILKLPEEKLVITVFGGEGKVPADHEARQLWKDVSGFPEERIVSCGAADNFWQMGETGPCGPCSEIHYFLGDGKVDPRTFGQEPTPDGKGWFELWNLVFMQFNKQANGHMQPLPAPSIDTGAGLERLSVVTQEVLSNYDTDLLKPIVELASQISEKKYARSQSPDDISMRVIADHARTTAFLISEGIFPDRDGRAYVLRRVMRRAIRHGHRLGINQPFLHECTKKVIDMIGDVYPELQERKDLIIDITQQEEERFRRTLKRGLDLIETNEQWSTNTQGQKTLPGHVAFKLYDTFGFPMDLQEVIGKENGFEIDQAKFEEALTEAKEKSAGSKVGDKAVKTVYRELKTKLPDTIFCGYEKTNESSEIIALVVDGKVVDEINEGDIAEIITKTSPFYAESGGQVGDKGTISSSTGTLVVTDTKKPVEGLWVHYGQVNKGELKTQDAVNLAVQEESRDATKRNHSATHLLHWALRQVLGPSAMQKGSLVAPNRLRFDYSASKPLKNNEIKTIEQLVNQEILKNVAIKTEVLPIDEAKEKGAIGIFEEKYGDEVRMLHMGPSLELCGGTHANRTGDIGLFKILSDSGLAAGVRRIEAVTGLNALEKVFEWTEQLQSVSQKLKTTPTQIEEKIQTLIDKDKNQTKQIEALHKKLISNTSFDPEQEAQTSKDGTRVLGKVVDLKDTKTIRDMADKLRDQLSPAVILLGAKISDKKCLLVCSASKGISKEFHAGNIVKKAAEIVGGGGGGRPDFAQAGGSDPSKLTEATKTIYALIE